jgi:hypothetical protein
VGIPGNEIVDKLAVASLDSIFINQNIPLNATALKNISRLQVLAEWETFWVTGPDSVYKKLVPNINSKNKLLMQNCKKINRIRYGQTTLDNGKVLVGMGQKCPTCGVTLDISHYILNCGKPLNKLIFDFCNTHKIAHTITNVLSNIECLKLIITSK